MNQFWNKDLNLSVGSVALPSEVITDRSGPNPDLATFYGFESNCTGTLSSFIHFLITFYASSKNQHII